MPIYDYQCSSCKAKVEVKHGINEVPNLICDHCGKNTMEKIISVPPHLTFNGQWFKTKGEY